MAENYKLNLVGVFGSPVAENPSCVMHEAAFAALSLPWRYLTLEVAPKDLPDAVRGARALGMEGFNLTIPHKVAVMPFLDEISPDAQLIGAVNTVRRDGQRLIGENTDGKGFLRALREDAGTQPAGKSVLVLGAGGAARAITVELALAGAAKITILNRTTERGQALCDHLEKRAGSNAKFEPWRGRFSVGPSVDVLINATSIGLFPDVDRMPEVDLTRARKDLLVCDIVPNPPETHFVQAARKLRLKTITGLGMLVYQGAIGFEMWTGRKPPESAMKAALEKAFATV